MRKSIKIGAVIGYISMLATSLISLILTPILLDNLGDSEYGVYALISSVIAYFSIFDMGLGNTGIRYIAKYLDEEDKVKQINGILLKIYLFISLIIFVVAIVIYFNIENIFTSLNDLELSKFKISFIIMMVSVAISFPFSVFNSYIMAKEEFIFHKIITLLHSLLKPFIMIPLLMVGYKSIGMIVVVASLNIFTYVSNFIYAKFKLGFDVNFAKFEERKKIIKEIFAFSFFIFLTKIVDTVFNNTDQVILGAVSGTFAVSLYDVSMQIRRANTNFSTVISSMFLPKLTKMVKNNEPISKISNIFLKVSRIQMFILLLILSGFIIFGNSFINLWVGSEYSDAYYIILICMVPNFIPLTQNIGIQIIQAMNKHRFRSVMFLIISFLNIGLSIPLSMKWGGIGAAIGTAIAVLCGQIITMNWYYSKKIGLDIKAYWKNFVKIFCPVIAVAIILNILISSFINNYVTLIIGIMIYTIIYCIYLYFVIMNNYEKDIIYKFFKKLKIIK